MNLENILDIKTILRELKKDSLNEKELYKQRVKASLFTCATCRFCKNLDYNRYDCIFFGRMFSSECDRYNIRRKHKKYLSKEELQEIKNQRIMWNNESSE